MKSKVLKIFLYIALFCFSYLLFVYWTFPMEALKSRLILGLEKGLGGAYQASIEEMDTYRITGASLQGLTISALEEGKKKPFLKIDEVTARAGLFSLLFNNPKIRFRMDLPGGRITGTVQKREEGFKIEGSFGKIDLGKVPYFSAKAGLNLVSEIGGILNLTYNPQQPLRTAGEVEIRIGKLFLKESTIPLGEMGNFPLPPLDLAKGPSVIKAEIGRGSIRVESFQFKGEDLQLDLKGRVFMASEAGRYRINLQGNFQFSEKLWQVLDPNLPEHYVGELKKQTGQAGLYPISISGQLSSPQIYSGALRLYPFKLF